MHFHPLSRSGELMSSQISCSVCHRKNAGAVGCDFALLGLRPINPCLVLLGQYVMNRWKSSMMIYKAPQPYPTTTPAMPIQPVKKIKKSIKTHKPHLPHHSFSRCFIQYRCHILNNPSIIIAIAVCGINIPSSDTSSSHSPPVLVA